MNRDELLEKLAMSLAEWPDGISSATSLPNNWVWVYSGTSGRMRVVAESKEIGKTNWLTEREHLINKPSWGDVLGSAPWARFITQVADGWWHAYDDEPYAFGDTYLIGTHGGKSKGICKGAIPAGHDWRQTLERRPYTLTTSLGASEQPYCPMLDSEMSPADAINPDHYRQGGIECIEAMQAMLTTEELRGYLRGNSFKYRWRYRNKNGIEDLNKARWYEDKLLELEVTHE
ncbi:MAG TPA: DUF3310 domain-containing protein [Modicisalibacter sp.]|nr:DUF3310 domain-containing protein [Modicisalibacter sp.]